MDAEPNYGLCKACSFPCLTCDLSNSDIICYSCYSGYYLDSKTQECVEECPNGYYGDDDTK